MKNISYKVISGGVGLHVEVFGLLGTIVIYIFEVTEVVPENGVWAWSQTSLLHVEGKLGTSPTLRCVLWLHIYVSRTMQRILASFHQILIAINISYNENVHKCLVEKYSNNKGWLYFVELFHFLNLFITFKIFYVYNQRMIEGV